MASPGRLKDAVLILPAGGKGERMAALAGTKKANKVALKAGGTSMIGRTLAMYARAGITRVVALVFHHVESVAAALEESQCPGVRIAYSRDPRKPVGKGGAIRLAYERGLIPEDRPLIVHNPDDQILRIDRTFPSRVFARHLSLVKRGVLATAVCVPWTEYTYSAFVERKGLAASAAMYPKVRMPTHTGITLFAPGAVKVFRRLIPRGKKVDFESVVLPYLARRRKLGIATVPTDSWIPVNDLKSYNRLLSALKK